MSQADIQIRQLRQQILKQKQTIEQQREELDRQQEGIVELKCERDCFIEENMKLRDTYQKLQGNIEEEITKKIKEKHQTDQADKDEERKMRADLKKKTDEVDQLEIKVEDLQEECKALKERFKKDNTSKETMESIATYTNQKEQFRKALNERETALTKLRNDMENILAENRVLRKLAHVPDNYGFNLEEVKFAEQQKIEGYKKQVRYLEREVEELEKQRTQLRSKLRTAVLLKKGNQVDKETENLISEETTGTKSQRERLDKLLDQLEKMERRGASGIEDGAVTSKMMTDMKDDLTKHLDTIIKQQQSTIYLNQPQTTYMNETVENMTVKYEDQQQQILRGGYVNQDMSQQMRYPPEYANHAMHATQIPGKFGDQGNITEGITNRFGDGQGQKIPVDTYDLYTENGFDQIAAKQEIATLQLMNIENMKIMKEKNIEYDKLREEVEEIKKQNKINLLVQDDLFQQHFSQKTFLEEELKKQQEKSKDQLNTISELQMKIKSCEDYLDNVKQAGPETDSAKLASLTKTKAILEVNLIQLSRKYACLKEEFDDLSEKYLEVDKVYTEKEQKYVGRIQDLIDWKKRATVQLRFLLQEQKKSVPEDVHNTLIEKFEDVQSKYSDLSIKYDEINIKYAELRGTQREVEEKNEQILVYQEEISELNIEMEIVKKRLEELDPLYRKYQECFRKLVEYCKNNNFSPLEAFQKFDINKDGKLSKIEFTQIMDSFNLDLHESELSTVFMFIDIDGSDNVDYPEFVRKLSRAGVKIRNEDEKIVYNLYQKIQQIGYSIKDIFMSFDKNFDNNITKDELGAGFEKVGIQIDQKDLDKIFNYADISRDGAINYDEFRSLFENILADQLREDLQIKDDELDIKQSLMISLDHAARNMGLQLIDIYKLIDKDQDQQVAFHEFKTLLKKKLKLELSHGQIVDLFNDIDKDGNKYIQYNELLGYIRQAKQEYTKIQQAKKVNERIQKIKEGSGGFDIRQENEGQGGEMGQVQRIERKMYMLELREKNAQQKVESQKKKLVQQAKEVTNLEVKISNLESEVLKAHKNYYETREKAALYMEKVQCCISKEESETINAHKQKMLIENSELKAALKTFKTLYQQSIEHVKVLKLTDEKRKHELSTIKDMRENIKDMQSESDDKALIGKMYHQLMICRWQQGEINKKYDTLLDENRQDKIKLKNQDYEIKEQELELDNIHKEYYITKRNKDGEIQKLKGKIIPTVSLHRIEELHNKLSSIVQQKVDLEITNRRLKENNNELQLKCDYFETVKSEMEDVQRELKTRNIDSHQQKIMEQGQTISELKLAEMKARRETGIAKEKEEYYQRVNRQHQETIKVMETEIAESSLKFNEREEMWRKRLADNENLFTKKQLQKEQVKKDNQDLADRLHRDRQINMKKARIQSGQYSIGTDINSAGDYNMSKFQQESENDQSLHHNQSKEFDQEKDKAMSLEHDLHGAQEQISDLKEQNKKLAEHIQSLQASNTKQMSRQTRQTAHTNKDIEEITQKAINEESEKFTRVAQQTIQTLQQLIDEKNEHLERRDELIQKMRKQFMQEKEKDIAEIRKLNNQIVNNNMSTVNRMQQSVVQHNGQVIESAEYWQDVGQLLHEKDKKIGTMVEDFEKERNEHKNTKKKVRELQERIEELRAELQYEVKKNETKKLSDEVEKVNKKLKEKDRELKKIQNLVKQFKEESFKIAAEKSDQKSYMEKVIKDDKSKISAFQDQLTNALEDVKKTRQQMRQAQQELEEMNLQGIDQRRQIKELEDENKALKNGEYSAKDGRKAQKQDDGISDFFGGKTKKQDDTQINTKIKELQNKNKDLTQENQKLKDEVQIMKTQEKISEASKQGVIDDDGTLKAPGMVFKSLPELMASIQKYDVTNTEISVMSCLKKYDTLKKGEVKLTNFYRGLQDAGIKLKKEDKKLIEESEKLLDNKNYIQLVPFYYMLKPGVSRSQQSEEQKQQQSGMGMGIKEKSTIPSHRTQISQKEGASVAQLERKINLINKQLYEVRRDKETIEKQLQNQREKYARLEKDYQSVQSNPRLQTTQKRVSTTQANAIGELKDTIYQQEEQIEKYKVILYKKDVELQKLGEDRNKVQEDLKNIKLENLKQREKMEKYLGSKIGADQLRQDNQSEKDDIIRHLKENLEQQRGQSDELKDKYFDLVADNKELMFVKENFDIQVERLQRRIIELEEYKKLQQGVDSKKIQDDKPDSPVQQSTLKKNYRGLRR